METPLTPLEFARRARRLYPDREAVVDGDVRLTYEQFFDRCDRWSAALQGLGVGRATASPTSRRTRTRSSKSFYAVPQIGAVLVPINYRLIADDFAYIINHSGAQRRLRARRLSARRSTASATQLPGVEHFVALEGAARGLARLRGSCSPQRAGDFTPPGDRRERPADDQLHQRHDLAPEGRDDHAPQRLHERGRHAGPPAHDARRTATCGRCRCSTPTAGPSSGPSPRSAATHVCLRRVEPPRVFAADRARRA